jgi:predicted metalloprotease
VQIALPDGAIDVSDVGNVGGGTTSNDVRGDAGKDFVARVLGSTERVWTEIFADIGKKYQDPKLILFTGFVESACGSAEAAIGPFYCSRDHKIYIDLSFYQDLKTKFGASGDSAQAYVIAHEVGHHVQNLLGIAENVTAQRMRVSEEEGNSLLMQMELQADCLAGVWAQEADKKAHILEAGDVEKILNAAAQIGDDRLRERPQGYVVPESFTHGTSEQRVRWLKKGLAATELNACDTFGTNEP